MKAHTPLLVLSWLLLVVASGARAQSVASLPPGLSPHALEVVNLESAEAPRAFAPLAEVLDRLEAMDEVPEVRTTASPPQAIRLYVSGRQKLIAGEPSAAAQDFFAATSIDPTAIAPNEALGALLLQGGLIAQGMDAYRRAVEAGTDTPTVLLDVANELLRQGQPEQAAVLLVRGLASKQATDPNSFARPLLLERLQAALAREGWIAASVDAASQTYHRIESIDQHARNPALAVLRRTLGNRWIDLGDRSHQIGEPDAAREYYQLADEAGADWVLLAPRRAWSLVASNQFEQALDAVLPADEPQRLAAGLTTELLEWLRDQGLDRNLLLSRIELAAQSWPEPIASLNTRLVIARDLVRDGPPLLISPYLLAALDQTPKHRGLLRTVASHVRTPEALADILAAHPRSARGFTREWLDRFNLDPSAFESLDANNPDQAFALGALWLELGRPDLAADVLSDQPDSLLKAQALAGDTRWEAFETTLSALDDPVDKVQALIAARRLTEAQSVLEEAPESSAAAQLHAQLAMLQLRPHDAVAKFDSALENDAYDTHAMRGLVALCAPGKPAADPRKFEPALAALRLADPHEPMVAQMDSRRIAQFEGVGAALDHALGLIQHAPTLSGIITEIALGGSDQDQQRAIDALLELHRHTLTNGHVLAPLVVMLVQTGDTDQARELIDAFTGESPDVRDLAESIDASSASDPRRARLEHLSDGPRTIERTLRLAEANTQDQPSESVSLVERALHGKAELTPIAYATLMRTVLDCGQIAERTASINHARATLDMIEHADAAGVKSAWQIRLVGFSSTLIADRDDPDAVASSVRTLASAINNPNDAKTLAQRYRGTRTDAGTTIEQARAEVAYALAGALYQEGLEAAAMKVYRITLDFNPDHVWANNDLGYFLSQKGGSLDEAARLVERAYAQEPDEINILDSLAWLRYLQGRLLDDDRGPGAVTLYERALATEAGRTNDTIQEQAGDVFWTSGRHDRATAAWEESLTLVEQLLTRVPEGSPPAVRWEDQKAGLLTKLERARSGGDPLAD